MKNTKQQKGSLLIEVVAVIGLLALITPILFQQIRRRNEEIVNAQIASEMRMLKDAASAYIRANEDIIAKEECSFLWDSTEKKYKNIIGTQKCYPINVDLFSEYMVDGKMGFINEYTASFYGYTVLTKDSGSCADTKYCPEGATEGTVVENNKKCMGCEFRPVIYAVIAQASGNEMDNLRRAAKVASLIGVEGGVVTDGEIKGMNGVWALDKENDMPNNAVVVVTSFDDATASSILKDVRWQHVNAETAQADTILATKNIGTKGILTVDNGQDCISDFGNGTITINESGTNTCAPFFEVNPTTKEVKLAGVIKTGVAASEKSCANITVEADCNRETYCLWDTNKNLCVNEYLLDLKNTSAMNDIKLGSRGGMRLSDLLPNWSLKNVRIANGSGNVSFTGLSCPKGSKYGIVIVPTSIQPASTFTVDYINNLGSPKIANVKDEYINVADDSYTVQVQGDGPYLVHEYCVFE